MVQNRDRSGKHVELTERIIHVFYRVYNELGYGLLESVYEEAMVIVLLESSMKVMRQVPVPVWFHGRQIGDFRADLLVDEIVLLELKAVKQLDPAHAQQTLNYLRATDIEIALLLNFGFKPEIKRLVFDNERKASKVNLMEWIRHDRKLHNV